MLSASSGSDGFFAHDMLTERDLRYSSQEDCKIIHRTSVLTSSLASDPTRIHEASIVYSGAALSALYLIKPLPTLAADRKTLRKAHPDFINPLFTFFLTPRTPAQLISVQDVLNTCRCNMRNSGVELMHDLLRSEQLTADTLGAAFYHGDRFKGLVSRSFGIMSDYVLDLQAGRLESVSKSASTQVGDAHRANGSAPRATNPDVSEIPRGNAGYKAIARFLASNVEETVRTCAQWYSLTHLSAVLTFLHQYIHSYSILPASLNLSSLNPHS